MFLVEEELEKLVESVDEPESILDAISAQVSKQEDQLLADALLLEDLTTLPSDEMLQVSHYNSLLSSQPLHILSTLESR